MDIDRNIGRIRAEFPALARLTYLNSAAHGPTLKRVHTATEEWWQHRINEEDAKPPDAQAEAAKLLHCSALPSRPTMISYPSILPTRT